MNIGMILDKPFPADPRVANEASTLVRQGHQVFLYCFDYSGALPQYEVIEGIQVCRYRVAKWMYSISALAYTIPVYHMMLKRSIIEFIQDRNIQALHIHDITVARVVFQANEHFDLPIILDLHENRPEIMKYYHHVNTPLGKLLIRPSVWKKFEGKYMREATKVLLVTELAKAHYVKTSNISPEKIIAVPNTVRKSFYTDYKTHNEIIEKYKSHFTLLYWGHTALRRGVRTVISAMPKLIEEIPNIKFICAGRSPTDHILERDVVKHGVEKYVDLVGMQDPLLFHSFIIASDLCVCPLHRNIHHDTTYANKIFQYLSMERPIIVSDSTAQAEIARTGQCGLVFEDRNAGDLADQILRLYRDPGLRKSLGANGRQIIEEQFHWENTSRALGEMYKQLEAEQDGIQSAVPNQAS